MNDSRIDDLKDQAARRALEDVRADMVLGLGTGSTMAFFIRALGERVRGGLKVSTVATSVRSADLAAREGIPVRTFREHKRLDLTVDGADEVSPDLDLVKGLGGALVREKIVAKASRRFVVVVDEDKLVDRLGTRSPIPVEVVPFAEELVVETLRAMGGDPRPRVRDGVPFRSDNGNHILDWHVPGVGDPAAVEARLKAVTGVVDSGIFANMADRVIVAGPGGVRTLERSGIRKEEAR